MIIFGWGFRIKKQHGKVFAHKCEHCNNEVTLILMHISEWFTLFFIPVIPYKWQTYLACPICGLTYDYDRSRTAEYKEIARLHKLLDGGAISPEEFEEKLKNIQSQ